jgi:hypothetical protein
VRTTNRERERAVHEAQLEHMREQVSAGALVIRQMTRAERATADKQLAKHESRLTPAERTTRIRRLRERRRYAAYLRASPL